jgi:hypothetical protein
VNIYPNPAHGTLWISFDQGVTGRFQAILYNKDGKIVTESELSADGSGSVVPFELNGISPGIYILQFKNDSLLENKKVVVY